MTIEELKRTRNELNELFHVQPDANCPCSRCDAIRAAHFLIDAEIERQKRNISGYIPEKSSFGFRCGHCGYEVGRPETECDTCYRKIDWDGYDKR